MDNGDLLFAAFLKYYAARASLVSCASWSPPRMLTVFPSDLWLSIRTRPLLSFWNCDPLTDRLPPIALSSSSESALTRSSKRRLDVGYLDIDFVIPCNLAQDRNNQKIIICSNSLLQMGSGGQKYLRANASISACFRSFRDGKCGRVALRRFGSLINSTRFWRYASSSSVNFSALIWSLMTIRGSKNQSNSVFLGLLSDVISQPSPANLTRQVKLSHNDASWMEKKTIFTHSESGHQNQPLQIVGVHWE